MFGATTNPLLVKTIVESCYDAGAKRIYVFDVVVNNTSSNVRNCYKLIAIASIGLDEKKLVQIAEASLLEDVCVVFVRHGNCGACGEVCPAHAIRFVDKNNILYPEINKKYCIGCGAAAWLAHQPQVYRNSGSPDPQEGGKKTCHSKKKRPKDSRHRRISRSSPGRLTLLYVPSFFKGG